MTWPGQKNGVIGAPPQKSVGRGLLLEPHAAMDLVVLSAASAVKFGAAGSVIAEISSAYRPLGKPSDKPDDNAPTQWAARNYFLIHKSPLAAVPGTSNHGFGQAIDINGAYQLDGTPQRRWLLAEGPKYGWTFTGLPGEPWHFQHLDRRTIFKATVTVRLPLTSLTSIARKHKVSLVALMAANPSIGSATKPLPIGTMVTLP